MKSIFLGFGIFSLLTIGAQAGHETGHGGDSRAASFVSIAHQIVADLKERPVGGIDTAQLERAILTTRVRVSDDVLIDVDSGKPVDAINHPKSTPPEIVIQKSAWDSISSASSKRRLVLHEYLGISGLNDRRYQLSSRLDRAQICDRSASTRAALERAFGGTDCDRISENDLLNLRSLEFRENDDLKRITAEDLAGLNLDELNVVIPDFCALEAKTASRLKRITSHWKVKTPQSCAFFKNFKNLKRLELHRVESFGSEYFSKLPAIEELVLVSNPDKPATIEANAFSALKKSPLRRLVLCDTSETGEANYVKIPNFILEKGALRGLSRVTEVTLCLDFSTSVDGGADKYPLKDMPALTYVWIKPSEANSLASDFFMSLLTGSRVALVPSGQALEEADLSRFQGLDCSSGWDWSKEKVHKFVSGKRYCVRK